ncbi:hypothetical protein R1sor_002641 [Riccia sorocarpa]|uniref:Uncharacterized protein n=1 Tax=Riccia sorocarpa TaxID=122646 RepID=A0ABD3H5G0_9MARC
MASSLMILPIPGQCLPRTSNRNAVTRNGTGIRSHQMLALLAKWNSVALRGSKMRTVRKIKLAASPSDEKQETSSSESREVVPESRKLPQEEKPLGLVEKIEKELGRQFGKSLWFGVLLVCLAIFGGGYVYCIYNFANFDDIPILRGPIKSSNHGQGGQGSGHVELYDELVHLALGTQFVMGVALLHEEL